MPLKKEKFHLRPVTFADLDAVYTIIAQQNTADFGSARLSLENLRQRWLDTEFSLANQTLVAVAANGHLAGYAEIRPSHPHQFSLQLYLAPTTASPNLGPPLLAALDKGYSNPLSFDAWAKRMSLGVEPFDPTLWFLACAGEEIVGVSLNFFLPEHGYGVIDHLGVLRHWRGHGIGLALLHYSFAAFFARGITKIKLNVDSGSLTNAPRLYEKAGMQTVQTYHIYGKTIGRM